MGKTKIISVRIDGDTLEEIHKFVVGKRYWKRNAVINSILTSLFMNANEEVIHKLVTWWKHSSTKLEISVEASRK